MTVLELIHVLEALDPSLPVFVAEYDEETGWDGYRETSGIGSIAIDTLYQVSSSSFVDSGYLTAYPGARVINQCKAITIGF